MSTADVDLAPLPKSMRTWRWHTYLALWVAMLASPSMYSVGGSLITLGLSPAEAMVCATIGGTITALGMVVNSAPGVAYGIPFPVYARSAYGIHGARVAALSRGLVGVLWLSFNLWLGADAICEGLAQAVPGLRGSGLIWEPYLTSVQLVMLLVVALLHVGLVSLGARKASKLAYGAAPFGIATFVVIGVWALAPAGGAVANVGLLHLHDGVIQAAGPHWLAWLGGINVVVSCFSTMLLNMADLARFAPRQTDQALGQMLGIPIPMGCACGVGILGAAAVMGRGGSSAWLMVGIFPYLPAWGSVVISVLVLVSIVVVNVGANIIPPANDFMNMSPRRLDWHWCAYATIVLAVLACPFYLFHSPTGFALRFMGGYGMVTGAIYGVMVSDYYVVRDCNLSLQDLYPEKPGEGACQYSDGHNWRAWLATLLGICLPFIVWLADLAGQPLQQPFWLLCDRGSWFVACPVAALVYVGACAAFPPTAMATRGEADYEREEEHVNSDCTAHPPSVIV